MVFVAFFAGWALALATLALTGSELVAGLAFLGVMGGYLLYRVERA